jgi:hypothetical protein
VKDIYMAIDGLQGFGLCTAIWNGMRAGVWTLLSLCRMGPPTTQAFGHLRLICRLVLSSEKLVRASTINVDELLNA